MTDEGAEVISNIADVLDHYGIAYDQIVYALDPITDRFQIHIHFGEEAQRDENSP